MKKLDRRWQEKVTKARARFKAGVWTPEIRKLRKRGILPVHREMVLRVINGGKHGHVDL